MSRPVRVVADVSVLGWGHGGISRYLRGVLPYLACSPDIDFTALANSRHPVVRLEGVREIDRRIKGGAIWRTGFLSPRLAVDRPDVFWLPDVHPPPWCPRPYVVTVHDLAGVLLPGVKPRTEVIAYQTIYRRAVAGATKVIAVSQSTAKDLQRHWDIDPRRITVVPLGVDDRFRPLDSADAARSSEAVEKRWRIGGPYVLVAGTVEARKGLDILPGIARQIGPDRKIVVAGRFGHGAERVLELGERSGVRFLGPVSDRELLELYRAASALLLPSLYEGFGLTALEAMACGVPVIASAGAGSLGEYDRAAILVESRDPAEWARALRDLPERSPDLVKAGLRLAAAHRWSATATSTVEVLTSAYRETV